MIFRWLCRLRGAEECTPLSSDNSEESQVRFICVAHESHVSKGFTGLKQHKSVVQPLYEDKEKFLQQLNLIAANVCLR